MIFRPNYTKAENQAYKLIKISGTTEFPIKVKKIAKIFSNLKIRSYSWFAKKNDMTLEKVCEFAKSDEGCCWYRKSKNQYMILYNDSIENVGRVRWTIAHELGHFMLKHNERTDKTIFARSSLLGWEYDVYEKEANCFARTLLAPPNVLIALGKINPGIIADICGLSTNAASNVYRFILKGSKNGIRYSQNWVTDLFSKYIYDYKFRFWCFQCNHSYSHKHAKYCPICGGHTLVKELGDKMLYSGYKLDENFRAIQCPRCDNEKIIGDHCHICGTYLINKCTGFRPEQMYQEYFGPWHIKFEHSCGEILDGDARYCLKCGSTSTFLEAGLLIHWQNEKSEIKTAIEEFAQNKPKGRNSFALEITDDDLPF
ncbi:MAG TPA: ImmA/IrrE family metallo-endopeptidase [Bacillota bacterium]|nr:ImmA/IrrE family metallo-endopeptidase [Bacillota bacterium]